MARPTGKRIRAICELLESIGPQGISGMRSQFPDIERANLGKYCSRGVGLGLLTVETQALRRKFTVIPEWREIADKRKTTREAVQEVAKKSKWHGVSSVFNMGGI